MHFIYSYKRFCVLKLEYVFTLFLKLHHVKCLKIQYFDLIKSSKYSYVFHSSYCKIPCSSFKLIVFLPLNAVLLVHKF